MIGAGRYLAPWLLLAVTGAACTSGAGSSFATTEPRGAEVAQVLDGDSVAVVIGGDRQEVRLLGINAPERDECYDREATQALRDLLNTERVELSGEDTDRFGRLLAYLRTPDGTDVNLELVATGAALAMSIDHERERQFKNAEADAYDRRIGRWQRDACGGPGAEIEVVIKRVNADAPGEDNANRNGEWVEITNEGPFPVDLSGWGLADESSQHRFSFPREATLEPGTTVRVYSGAGEASRGSYYWDASDPVWSNRGDTAYLTDSFGNVVSRYAY